MEGSLLSNADEIVSWNNLPTEINKGVFPKCSSTTCFSQGSPYPDVIETNMQLESVGCPVSNTSCIGQVSDAIECQDENKAQVSAASLDVARSPSETKSSMFEGGSLVSRANEIISWSRLPTEITEGVSSKCPSTTYQGSPHPDVNETNMQMESVGCLVSNISWDGEVPDKMESPCKETPQVSATYLDVVRNPLETRLSMFGEGSFVSKANEIVSCSKLSTEITEGLSPICASTMSQGSPPTDVTKTNLQLESVGCIFSNTSCDGEVPDKMESPCTRQNQVSVTSLNVASNLSETNMQFDSVGYILGNTSCNGGVPDEMESPCTKQTQVSITSLDVAINPSETNMQFDSVGCILSNTSCDGEVPDEMESPCKTTQVSVTSVDVTKNSSETNMQLESAGYMLSNTSCDGEVPDEMESPCKTTQVPVTSLDVTKNSSETNMQLESAGYMLSNTSCDGEVPDEMESPSKKQTQVSITSLGVATNPSESNMQFESVGCILTNTSCDEEVSDEMESPCKKQTQVSVTSLDMATNPLDTNMQLESVGCILSNTSWDGEVPDEVESPYKKQTQVSITSLDVATNPSETNMQFESIGCSLVNTSCDGDVPNEMESPCKKQTQVSVTSLDMATNPSETNMQLESVGCILSNTSWDGEVPDEMESPYKKQTQVSITSLDVATNPSETNMQFESIGCSLVNTICDGEVLDEMESPCRKKTLVSITSLDVAANTSETNMQLESVGCSIGNTSCDGEVSDEMESPCKKKTLVSITSLDVATNPSETNMQLESVGCSLSNNSCDEEVPAEAESPRMKKTQVSITSLDVATNPLETNMQSDSVGCMLSNTSCDGEVPDEMESQCKKQTQVSITSGDVATNLSETQMSTLEGGSLASKSSDIMYWSTSPAEITEGVSPRFASIVYQGSPRSDTNGNNMKPEAVGCSLSNTSCAGDVPDKIESPRNNNTLVSSRSLINVPKLSMFEGRSFVSKVDEIVSWSEVPTEINEGLSHVCASTTCQGSSHTDTNETNRQPEAVGCSLSNTSCDGEVLDGIEGPVKNKTQVSAASLVVARNPSDSKSSMFEKSLLEIGDPPSFTVQSPVASATSLDGSIKIDLDTADMSSFSCNAGTSIEKKTCDCQTAVSLENDSNPLITKSSRFVGLVTVESASPIAVKEQGSTGDSLSHSRVSLGTGAVEARKNSKGCERRSESPSLNKSLEKGKKRKLERSGPECSDLRSDEPLPKFPCLFTETEEHQAKSPGTEVTIEHPPAEDLGEPTDPETSTGKNISQQPKGKTRKRKRSAPESPDTSERESEEPLQKSRFLVMETKEPQVVSPQAEEPRVKVEIGADPQSPEALEYAHFCLRNAYHALLGATAKNITIQTQVTVEPSRNRGRRNRIKRVWNGESFVPETEVQVHSEPYKRRRRRRRN